MLDKSYVGEINKRIVLNCFDDITGYEIYQIQVLKPDGKILTWDATQITIEDKSYYLEYFTQTGDLDIPGKYRLQAIVGSKDINLVPTAMFFGETAFIVVYDRFN